MSDESIRRKIASPEGLDLPHEPQEMAAYTARLTGNPPFCIYLGVAVLKIVACYIRVSKGGKSQAAQEDEIRRWLKKHRINARTVRWYIDTSTRIKLCGPKLETLQADIHDVKVDTVIVWRIDRLSPIMRDGLNRYGPRAWSSMVVKRLEDDCGAELRAPGFPEFLVDHEPEQPGAEVVVGSRMVTE